MNAEIIETANQVLAHQPQAIVSLRLMRDMLDRKPGDPDLQRARFEAEGSNWVVGLAAEQRDNGSWGAFHSRDTQANQKVLTTEMGVERALNLGLDSTCPILKNAANYIRKVMDGRLPFPDRHEKNDRWKTGMRLFAASTYARIYPHDSLLIPDQALWQEITTRTFHSGAYSPDDEARAHADLTGATVKNSYLVLNGKYQLMILGSLPNELPKALEGLLLNWLWGLPGGIGYLNVPLNKPPNLDNARYMDRWLSSHELLARYFHTWVDFSQEIVEWIWEQRRSDGLWDFGPRPKESPYLPLSENWRKRENRMFDWTTRILVLLKNYAERQT